MIVQVDDSKQAGSLIVDGALTIQRADEFKDALMKALQSVNQLEISFNKVTEVDLACLQLLCSAHRSCVKENKTLRISHQNTEALQKALQDAGFERWKGCKGSGDRGDCLLAVRRNQ